MAVRSIEAEELIFEPRSVEFDPRLEELEFMLFDAEVQGPIGGLERYDLEELKIRTPDKCKSYQKPEYTEASDLILYGRKADGCSVAVFVHGFMWRMAVSWDAAWCPYRFRHSLERKLKIKREHIHAEVVRKLPTWGYTKEPQVFCLLYFASPELLDRVHKGLNSRPYEVENNEQRLVCHEHDIDEVTQFLRASGGQSCGWFKIPSGKLDVRPIRYSHQRIEVHLTLRDRERYTPDTLSPTHPILPLDRAEIVPLIIASFDLEALGDGKHFCNSKLPSNFIYCLTISVYLLGQGIKYRYLIYFGELWDVAKSLQKLIEENKGKTEKEVEALKKYPIAGPDRIYNVKSEPELLTTFKDVLVFQINPDMIAGHGITNFDWPYIYDKVEQHKLPRFPYLSRLICVPSELRDNDIDTAALGVNKQKVIETNGQIVVDSILEVKRNLKPELYKLDYLAKTMLNVQKLPMDYEQMNYARARNDPEENDRIGIYGNRDADLPIYVIERNQWTIGNIEMARVTNAPLKAIYMRGQQVKVYSAICMKAHKAGYIVTKGADTKGHNHRYNDINQYKYQGATVIPPKRRFYGGRKRLVLVLDFSSLYPSIMQAHNLCMSTYRFSGTHEPDLRPEDVEYKDCGGGRTHCFVKKHVRVGIMPDLLTDLLTARGKAKKEMAKHAEGSLLNKTFNGRQLALKTTANSGYGSYGFVNGKFGLLPVAETVTAWGREGLAITQAVIEQWYPGTEVIYGDTDSVMLIFDVMLLVLRWQMLLQQYFELVGDKAAFIESELNAKLGGNWIERKKDVINTAVKETLVAAGLAEKLDKHPNKESLREWMLCQREDQYEMVAAFSLGREAAARVSEHFKSLGYEQISLAFEKVYENFLSLDPKNYAGIKYEDPLKTGKEEAKGLATVRRDRPEVAKKLGRRMLEKFGRNRPEEVRGVVAEYLKQILKNKIPPEDYALGSSLGSEYEGVSVEDMEDYVNCQTAVRQKIKERAPGTEPREGDRVQYVVIEEKRKRRKLLAKSAPKEPKEKRRVCDRVEDPEYLKLHPEIRPDRLHYLEGVESLANKLVGPVPEIVIDDLFRNTRAGIKRQLEGLDSVDSFVQEGPPPKRRKEKVKRKVVTEKQKIQNIKETTKPIQGFFKPK